MCASSRVHDWPTGKSKVRNDVARHAGGPELPSVAVEGRLGEIEVERKDRIARADAREAQSMIARPVRERELRRAACKRHPVPRKINDVRLEVEGSVPTAGSFPALGHW